MKYLNLNNYQALALALMNLKPGISSTVRDRYEGMWQGIMETAPQGAGFNSGTVLDSMSNPRELVFITYFFHGDPQDQEEPEADFTPWTEHNVEVQAHLYYGFELHITGRDQNGIKEYIHDTFDRWLKSPFINRE